VTNLKDFAPTHQSHKRNNGWEKTNQLMAMGAILLPLDENFLNFECTYERLTYPRGKRDDADLRFRKKKKIFFRLSLAAIVYKSALSLLIPFDVIIVLFQTSTKKSNCDGIIACYMLVGWL
jgi:hypothetical protein